MRPIKSPHPQHSLFSPFMVKAMRVWGAKWAVAVREPFCSSSALASLEPIPPRGFAVFRGRASSYELMEPCLGNAGLFSGFSAWGICNLAFGVLTTEGLHQPLRPLLFEVLVFYALDVESPAWSEQFQLSTGVLNEELRATLDPPSSINYCLWSNRPALLKDCYANPAITQTLRRQPAIMTSG
eukprot:Gb_36454 [translate_table: standard]